MSTKLGIAIGIASVVCVLALGVMNIMLQFRIEAVLVCLIGGTWGTVLALGNGEMFPFFGSKIPLIYSIDTMIWVFMVSSLIAVVFGNLSARYASSPDPVAALSGD